MTYKLVIRLLPNFAGDELSRHLESFIFDYITTYFVGFSSHLTNFLEEETYLLCLIWLF